MHKNLQITLAILTALAALISLRAAWLCWLAADGNLTVISGALALFAVAIFLLAGTASRIADVLDPPIQVTDDLPTADEIANAIGGTLYFATLGVDDVIVSPEDGAVDILGETPSGVRYYARVQVTAIEDAR